MNGSTRSCRFRRSAACLVATGLLAIAAPAPSYAEHQDHRACVTSPEFDRLPEDAGKRALQDFIDTDGWVAYRSLELVVKHYAFCDHPNGWLAVSYVPSKRYGWMFRASVLIQQCTTKHGDAPREPCDRSVPCLIEAALLRVKGVRASTGRQRAPVGLESPGARLTWSRMPS